MVLNDTETSETFVLRGPMSALPCFRVEVGLVQILFSHVDDLIDLNICRLSINWDCVTAQLANADYLCHETAIKEIEAVEGGECIRVRNGRYQRLSYWSPKQYLNERYEGSFEDAARDLRSTTDQCIATWAGQHTTILHTLSGGLDSSIVLAGLTQSPPPSILTAVTYFGRGCGDERNYARGMARRHGARLIELERNTRLDMSCFEECNRTVTPMLDFSAADIEARNIELASSVDATAIFNGELGDNIFGTSPSAGSLLEYFTSARRGEGFVRTALDYCQLTRQSIWQSLRLCAAERRELRSERHFSARRYAERFHLGSFDNCCLASTEALDASRSFGMRFIHPWLSDIELFYAGKFVLLFGLINNSASAHHRPFSSITDVPSVSPLASQPLVELVLKLPSYFHYHAAQDRAVARAAYADRSTPEVLSRGSAKGGPDLWAKDVINHNRTFLREFLLGGVLVDRSLLSREKVEAALSTSTIHSSTFTGDLFAQLYIESWARAWARVPIAVAA